MCGGYATQASEVALPGGMPGGHALWTRKIRVGTLPVAILTRKIRVGTLPMAIWSRKIRAGRLPMGLWTRKIRVLEALEAGNPGFLEAGGRNLRF